MAEDLHALLLGSSLAAFGLVILTAAGLVTGGLAGVALAVSYLTALPVGVLFVALNLPFFLFVGARTGWRFPARSILAMGVLALLASAIPLWLRVSGVSTAFAALFGGSLIGMGMLSLARHHASVGGVSMLAFALQQRRGWSAGLVQLTIDLLILAGAAFVLDLRSLAYSALSALAQNLVVAIYHRPGRYAGG